MKSNFAKSAVSTVVLAVAALGAANSFAAGQAFANPEGASIVAPAASDSNVSRAQVVAEYFQAQKAGLLAPTWEAATPATPAVASKTTRAAVRAETLTAARVVDAHPSL